jgi:hypothetical protein
MKKNPAAWLLAVLVALGAGQSAPLRNLQGSLEASAIAAIELVLKVRKEKRVLRKHATRKYLKQDARVFHFSGSSTFVHNIWHATLLRAPPLTSIA